MTWDEYVTFRRYMANLEAQTILQAEKLKCWMDHRTWSGIDETTLCKQCSFSSFRTARECFLNRGKCDVFKHEYKSSAQTTTEE